VLLIPFSEVEQGDIAPEARSRIDNPSTSIEDLGNRILITIIRRDRGRVRGERDQREGDETDGHGVRVAKCPVHEGLYARSAHLVLSTGRRFVMFPGNPGGARRINDALRVRRLHGGR